jgi:hypothetical protein
MKALAFSLLLFLAGISQAQSVNPQLLGTAGGDFAVSGADVFIAWSLGESVILTFEGESARLTNGFHQPDRFCFGDFNFDGTINATDLTFFLSQLSCSSQCYADLNGDLTVTSTDLSIFLSVFGTVCFQLNP